MKPSGYIWWGVGCAVVAVVILQMAHSNDALELSLAQLEATTGQDSSGGDGDGLANFVAFCLFAAASVLILIGAVGIGVRSGTKRD